MMSLLVQLFSNEESTNDLPVPSMLASRCRFHGIGRLAYVFGFTLSTGHCSAQSALRIWATGGSWPLVKAFAGLRATAQLSCLTKASNRAARIYQSERRRPRRLVSDGVVGG